MPTDNYIPPPGQNLLKPSDMIQVVVEVSISPAPNFTSLITKRFAFHTYPLAQEFITGVSLDPKATGSIIQALAKRAMLLRVPLSTLEGARLSIRLLPHISNETEPTTLMNPDDVDDADETETFEEDYQDDTADSDDDNTDAE